MWSAIDEKTAMVRLSASRPLKWAHPRSPFVIQSTAQKAFPVIIVCNALLPHRPQSTLSFVLAESSVGRNVEKIKERLFLFSTSKNLATLKSRRRLRKFIRENSIDQPFKKYTKKGGGGINIDPRKYDFSAIISRYLNNDVVHREIIKILLHQLKFSYQLS